VAKLAGEGYCRAFSHVYGLETVALRYFNIFGPRQDPHSEYSAVIPKFIAAYLEHRSPTIHGDGEQSRDFTYISNVVDANLLALDAEGAVGQFFNVACGDRFTLNQLSDHIREMTGSQAGPEYGPPRPGEVRQSQADISRACEVLGYEPKVDLREGLGRTIEHYASLAA
jgi:UDP-glucose 4-epimerase